MFCVDEQTMKVLKSVTVCVNVGRFKGQTVSVWDLLNSEYFSDSKRRELVQKYKDEKTEVLQEITTIITTIIQETEAQGKKFAFKGLRKRVSASDLFQSQLIDKKTLDELNQGKKTVKEVTEMESVRRYLESARGSVGGSRAPAQPVLTAPPQCFQVVDARETLADGWNAAPRGRSDIRTVSVLSWPWLGTSLVLGFLPASLGSPSAPRPRNPDAPRPGSPQHAVHLQ